jgi:NAD(P)-dependent dehydrogenase (short-subunit alcohol dehydrogenase family)
MASKTVLITGSSSGFGRAAAMRFRATGWRVAATMLDTDEWKKAETSDDLLVLPLNVEDLESIKNAVDRTIERFGKIDCVVNNAGRGLFSVFEATPMEASRSLFETNVFGIMQVTQAVLPHFRSNGGGRLINVSSGAGIVSEPLMSIYDATKYAVEWFTESIAYECASQNISVKLIEPGLVQGTNFIEKAFENSKTALAPPSYQSFVDQSLALYKEPSPLQRATESDVAEAIVAAATDTSGQLRHLVGSDAKILAHMRWETSEEQYRAWARSKYAPNTN